MFYRHITAWGCGQVFGVPLDFLKKCRGGKGSIFAFKIVGLVLVSAAAWDEMLSNELRRGVVRTAGAAGTDAFGDEAEELLRFF